MKCLTLTEPWATLMALHEKTIETRSWRLPRSVVGLEVAIHSAKGFPRWARETCDEEPFRTALGSCRPELHRGKIICVVKFIGYRLTEDVHGRISERERAFGDYEEGRFAWFSEFVKRLESPIPAIGHLGFWDGPDA